MQNLARRRVLYFAKAYPPEAGGVERYSADLALAFRETGCWPLVVTQHRGPAGLHRQDGLPVYNVGRGNQAIVFAKMLLLARRLSGKRRFAFSYATTWRVALPALLGANVRPLGCTIHGREVLAPRGLVAVVMRWVLKQVNEVFAVSDFTLNAARESGAVPPTTGRRNWNGLPSGIHSNTAPQCESHALARDAGTVTLFTICRLVARKNVLGVVRALALLKREGRLGRVEYLIAGDGETRQAIADLIDGEQLNNCVKLLGRVTEEEKDSLYARADLFVHPQVALAGGADVEGFGLVIAEAMARGLPVVVGRDGGTADFVLDGETGRVVDGNSDREIAEALAELIEDADLRHRYAAAGQAWVREHLSWRRHAEAIVRRLLPALPTNRAAAYLKGQRRESDAVLASS